MNSYSARVSVAPNSNWLAQVSAGRLERPERLEEGDVVRTTASLHYSRPLDGGTSWSTSLIWGRNHEIAHQRDVDSWLVETLLPATRRNFLTGRIEVVDKDELFAAHADDAEHGGPLRRAALPSAGLYCGYTRDMAVARSLEVGLGANLTAYRLPAAIQPYYGDHPWGVNVFLRVRLKSGQ